MRLTYTHFDFWAHHHAPPSLIAFVQAGKTSRYDVRKSIHACINDHAGWKPVSENTVTLLRSQRRYGGMLEYLIALGHHAGWSFNNAPRRAAWARKWARRVAQAHGPEVYVEVCNRLAYSEVVAQVEHKPYPTKYDMQIRAEARALIHQIDTGEA